MTVWVINKPKSLFFTGHPIYKTLIKSPDKFQRTLSESVLFAFPILKQNMYIIYHNLP